MSGQDGSTATSGALAAAQGIRTRLMTTSDLDAVCDLENQLFSADAWPRQAFTMELRDRNRYYLVAVSTVDQQETVVGYAGLLCLPPVGDVQTIAVRADHEGRGVGSTLLAELLAEAWRGGATEAMLEVREDNLRAQALYRRFGFEHIHTRPRYYRDGVAAWVMQLRKGASE